MAKPFSKLQRRVAGELSVQSLARSHTEMAIRQLACLAQRAKSESARVAACEILLQRGWGRPPPSQVDANGEGPVTVEIVYRHRDEPKVIEHEGMNGAPAAPQ